MNNNDEMSFLEHLEELRWHVLRAVMAILFFGSISFIFKDFIFDVIIFGPKNKRFLPINYSVQYPKISVKATHFVLMKYHLEFKAEQYLDNFQLTYGPQFYPVSYNSFPYADL